MENMMERLKTEELTCIVVRNEHVYTETKHGILPILQFLDNGILKDANVYDKVIGKAAAMMMVLGEVKQVETIIISEHAYQFLVAHHIPIRYSEKVPYIVNRKKDGMCPMEECVLDIDDMSVAYSSLKDKIKHMLAGK